MSYAKISDVRDFSNITTAQTSDSVLGTIRDKAENKLLRNLTIDVREEDMKSNLDGSYLDGDNNTFYTHHTPVADSNRDKTIDSSDVTVYVWGDTTDEGTRSEVTVSSVRAQTGRVLLSSPPSSGDQRITCDYSYYNSERTPDWDLMELSSIWLTSYLATVSLRGAVPSKYSIGDLKIDDDLPGSSFLREYRSTLNSLRDKMSSSSG